MPLQGITFDGQFTGLPGAYYGDDVSAAGGNNPPLTPPMLVLGYGLGAEAEVGKYACANAQDFAVAVRGAPVSSYIPFIQTPSPSLFGVQRITFIDVSRNTQSFAALTTSGGAAYATLTSTLYGPPSNQITYQIGSGSVTGRKLTLTDNYGGSQLIGDNLGVPFEVAYLGAASGGVSFTTSIVSGTFALVSPNAGESTTFAIGSGAYSTTALLAEAINGTGFFAAQGLSSTGGQLTCLLLDAVSGVLTSGVTPNYVNVPAGQNDLAFWVNQFGASVATAVTGAAAVSGNAALPSVGPPTFFTGATGVPPVNSDYASGLTNALAVPAWTVFCDSNATAVQALMASHCEIASSPPYGMWRRGFTGSSIGDSVATTETNATNLDSLQMVYAYPGIYATNTQTGQNQLYGGLYVAAAAASIAAGNIVALPLTNKVLNGTGVEAANAGAQLTNTQLEGLQNAGVMALWQTQQQNGPPTIVNDVTTWQADDNVENTSSQQVACRYWLAYSVVSTLRKYVGTIASPVTEVNITNSLVKLFNALIYTGGSSNGVLASWNQKSLILNYDGTQRLASVTVQVTLVNENAYITCFASVEPLQFQIVAS